MVSSASRFAPFRRTSPMSRSTSRSLTPSSTGASSSSFSTVCSLVLTVTASAVSSASPSASRPSLRPTFTATLSRTFPPFPLCWLSQWPRRRRADAFSCLQRRCRRSCWFSRSRSLRQRWRLVHHGCPSFSFLVSQNRFCTVQSVTLTCFFHHR
jgi:hypothetical protein